MGLPLYACCLYAIRLIFVDDGEIEITLVKMSKAETWPSALVGHGQLNAFASEEVRKKLMLERFQEEVLCIFI